MGRCVICGRETESQGKIYVGTPCVDQPDIEHGFKFESTVYHDYICSCCINKKLSHDFSGLGFYLFIQLLWFKVAQNGLSNSWGIFSFLIASAALVRILLVLARKIMQKFFSEKEIPRFLAWSENREEISSSLLKQKMLASFQENGQRLQTIQEYESSKKNRNKK